MMRPKMKQQGIQRCAFFTLILALAIGEDAAAQWADFKKGLQEKVQVAVESDSMLVAHHDAINFSFIATTEPTASSDIFRLPSDSAAVWQTTERFWDRLNKTKQKLETIFLPAFLGQLRHPEGAQMTDREQRRASQKVDLPPPKTLFERIEEAKDRGDFEVAALLTVIAQQQAPDSAQTLAPQRTAELQKRLLREKSVLEKMYTIARAHEKAGDWKMAAAVYENLLELGEFKDVRSRLAAVLPKQQRLEDSLQIEQKFEQGLAALQSEQWGVAVAAFEAVLAKNPDFSKVHDRLLQAQTALERANATPLVSKAKSPARFSTNGDTHTAHSTVQMLGLKNPEPETTAPSLPQAERRIVTDGNHSLIWVGGLLGMVAIIAVTTAGFSPNARAAIYRLGGRHRKAALLYEKQLQKNPGKLKIYGKLAAIYLQENRRDEVAMQVYTMIHKLNLQIKHRAAVEKMLQNPRSRSRDA